MTISMYQASLPVLIRTLKNLTAILGKAEEHAKAKSLDPETFGGCRLIADMMPLKGQIYTATDMAKGCAARLAGKTPPVYADDEATLPELRARIEKTVAYLEGFAAKDVDGSEKRAIVLNFGPNKFEFEGLDYLRHFVLPNFYFHVSMAYAILRASGVDIGKRDFLGAS